MATQCVGTWWAHPRRKRATAAAAATLAAPAVLGLLAAQVASERCARDVTGAAVRRLYDVGRLPACPAPSVRAEVHVMAQGAAPAAR
jgi:hypothetical protein